MEPKNKIVSFFNTLFVNSYNLKIFTKIEETISKMKLSEKILFYVFASIFSITSIILLLKVNDSFMVEIPKFGGSFTEGVVGSPRFINPVLAISDTDKDLSSIIYSGLLKKGADGNFKTDLAEYYNIDESGTIYDFILKKDIHFHDGKEVTADDVIFTINKILDPVIKSPKRSNFEGVTIEKINNKEIKFILKKPYSPFIETLTLGILPKHIWEKVSSEEFAFSQYNINPIGSGPYKIEKITKNSGEVPSSITLISWKKYNPERPKIKNITFRFFANENDMLRAYNNKNIDNVSGISPNSAKIISVKNNPDSPSLPRVFGVFFNQNVAPALLNKEVRQALDIATPKQKIVDEVLYGFGKVIDGPTPNYVELNKDQFGDIEKASLILSGAGWKKNNENILEKKTKKETQKLVFSITTSDSPELKQVAEILKEYWEKIGASVTIKVFESGDLSQNIIRPRKYDSLLFGEVVNENSDLYPFWHSSERNDPGLNIALYTNITVDKNLEAIQKETDQQIIKSKKDIITKEINKDIPAIFLFSPDFIYINSPKIKNVALKNISFPNERFSNIESWFIETDKVWKIFSKI